MQYYNNFKIQPIVDIKTNRVCGGELLYRPDGNALTDEILEDLDNNPIVNLEVTKQAFLLSLNILERIQSSVWLSINISPKFMGDGKGFMKLLSREVEDLDRIRRQIGKRLKIELTEKCVMNSTQLEFLEYLADKHEIAIDDFGSGIAPLKNMLDLNFTKIKVDKDIIKDIDYSETKQRFLIWLVSGSHSIGATVCAEGIETASQLMLCKRFGVDEGQGWLWSKAIEVKEFEILASPMETAAVSLGQTLEAKI
jgi:EAL domain-containing protein (putative c-di-GMP-specific phosphodiesterase class I)